LYGEVQSDVLSGALLVSRPRWQEVADSLRAYAGPASEGQLALAAHAGITVNKRLPQPVTAALLRRTLRGVLHLPTSRSASKGQLEYVRNLAAEVDRRILTPLDDQEIVNAWVKVFHALRAACSQQRLRPCVGDIVEVEEVFGRVPAEIASISADGRLNFKGGAGFGRRPHEAFLRVRASTPGPAYATARYQAAQAAALRREPGGRISGADLRELLRWYVRGGPTVTDVAAVSAALQGARDEKPLQAVLQQHPQLLTHLVTSHHGGYVRPEAWLSSQYRADFLVAGHTSLGLRWTLIELESPTAPLMIADGQASAQLRKAVKQIEDWREWLQNNLDHARRSRREQGLGLFGIRPHARGLILIGRGRSSADTEVLRNQLWERHQIDVRTYDWLLRESSTERDVSGVLDIEHDDEPDPFDLGDASTGSGAGFWL
jgi:hypothetical protein